MSRLVAIKPQAKPACVNTLKDLLKRAESGEIIALVCVFETKAGYEYTRQNIGIERAIGLHTRAAYKLNQDWDQT